MHCLLLSFCSFFLGFSSTFAKCVLFCFSFCFFFFATDPQKTDIPVLGRYTHDRSLIPGLQYLVDNYGEEEVKFSRNYRGKSRTQTIAYLFLLHLVVQKHIQEIFLLQMSKFMEFVINHGKNFGLKMVKH